MLTERQLLKRLKAGDVVTVRAKNGRCVPAFNWEPNAYRCSIGGMKVKGAVVCNLCKRRRIEPITRGWYTEGQFRIRVPKRDARGRFISLTTGKGTEP